MALVFVIIFMIMFCGYIFIYNVFDISIVNDIRFYGELKTIGMTAGQLRRMLFYQMNRISLWGIGNPDCSVSHKLCRNLLPTADYKSEENLLLYKFLHIYC